MIYALNSIELDFQILRFGCYLGILSNASDTPTLFAFNVIDQLTLRPIEMSRANQTLEYNLVAW